RRQREQGALKQLVGDMPVSVPRGPVAAAPVEHVEWWAARDKEHLLQNLETCGKIRRAVESQIGGAKAGELEKLANAVRALTETERELLELKPRSPQHKAPSLRPRIPRALSVGPTPIPASPQPTDS